MQLKIKITMEHWKYDNEYNQMNTNESDVDIK